MISARPMSERIETKLQWQNANYSLEYGFDDGFEFEQVIPFDGLAIEQQKIVSAQKKNADKIIIEAVYGIGIKSHEAYYFKNHKLIHQIDFN